MYLVILARTLIPINYKRISIIEGCDHDHCSETRLLAVPKEKSNSMPYTVYFLFP